MHSARLTREHRTIAVMVGMYCQQHHATSPMLCSECQALLHHADQRINRCPHGADKPSCANCTIHCYQPTWRERMRIVMRYAGPRMLWRHPWLALMHLIDSRRKPPVKPARNADATRAG